ncbi:hypothetical protein L1077_05365 [Pseudoalteromonas luteoviolacea]|uniref:hypothetical protein n=1 Tax=Pseudoalteromonas luteoviolacea TaxID=43657 RepID=UPI001F18A07F|nr:hypothetical protein [Pseudoalteromonas luteoviolacea]MCF6438859.1 hypothetical protein [Pseudoalteromonas luteoviolacea]
MRIYIFVFLFFVSVGLEASEKYQFDCSPYDGIASFRIKGSFEAKLKAPYLGWAHSYAPIGEHQELLGCRVPWYEKFILKGEVSSNYMLHAHEYVEGCMFGLEIPTVSGEGRMWVYRSSSTHEKTKPVGASCVVTKLQ